MTAIRKALALPALALALSGCAAANWLGPRSTAPATGTVTGQVTMYACPGPQAADGCPLRPAPGVVIRFAPAAGGPVVSATTGSNGSYSAALAAGTYAVSVAGRTPEMASGEGNRFCPPAELRIPIGCPASKYRGPLIGPREVTVEPGKTVTADYWITVPMV